MVTEKPNKWDVFVHCIKMINETHYKDHVWQNNAITNKEVIAKAAHNIIATHYVY